MTDFNIRFEVDYTVNSEYHEDGRAEIHLIFDPASRKAFYEWLAGGCEGTLEIDKKGCRFRSNLTPTHYPPETVPLTTESNKKTQPMTQPYQPTWSTTQITCDAGKEAQK